MLSPGQAGGLLSGNCHYYTLNCSRRMQEPLSLGVWGGRRAPWQLLGTGRGLRASPSCCHSDVPAGCPARAVPPEHPTKVMPPQGTLPRRCSHHRRARLPSIDASQQMPRGPRCPFPQGPPHAMPLSFLPPAGLQAHYQPSGAHSPHNIPKPCPAGEEPWHCTPEAESCPVGSHHHPLGLAPQDGAEGASGSC